MANHASAAKRHRQTVERAKLNNARTSRLRTFVKEVETAIASGDKEKARAALAAAQPELQRSAKRGILHRRTASRKLSRLNARIKTL